MRVHHANPEAPRVIMLVNPYAGMGMGAKVGPAALAVLHELGVTAEVHEGQSADAMRELATAAVAEKPDAVVVVGGDGTLSAVLEPLAHSGVALVVVPAGTGNDFGRAMGIRYENIEASAEAAALALHGTPKKIDLARISCENKTRLYLTVAAMGFDALVSERTNQLKWPRGAMRYYLALVIELLRLRPIALEVAIDGGEKRSRPAILAAVGNTSSYGGGMPMCPAADPADGVLDLTLVAPIGRLKLARLFPLLLKGKHTSRREVETAKVKSISVAGPGLIVYADGERVGADSVQIDLAPAALTVMVPA